MRLSVTFLLLLSLLLAAPARAEKRDYRETGVTVVHTITAHPFFFEGRKGELRGMLVDLWNAWSDKTGIPVHFKVSTWKDTLPLVLDGTYDIHAGLMASEERKRQFTFSQPLFSIETALIVPEGTREKTDVFLAKRIVGTVAGGLPGMILREKHPNAAVKEYDTPGLVSAALADGEVDGVVMDLPTFHFNNIELPTPVEYVVLSSLVKKGIHAGVRKDNTELAALVRDGFAAFSKKEMAAIQHRWFVVSAAPEPMNYSIWIGVAILALLLGLSASWLTWHVSHSDSEDH